MKHNNLYNKRLTEVDTRNIHERVQRGKNIKSEFFTTDEEAQHYTKQQTNRDQAIALLKKLKAREAEGMGVSKVYWRDGQPTLVESSSKLHWDKRLEPFGRPENKGLPATNSNPRVPAGWESKFDRKRRRQYTLAETPTMTFASASGMLSPEYYQDEEQLEAYINSLENDDNEQ
jgi:hypothetical protein